MGTTRRSERGTSAARLLGLLAVLLGLLSMHGLASTHHATAAPAVARALGSGVAGDHGHAVTGHVPPSGAGAGRVTDLHRTTPADSAVAAADVAPSVLPGPPCHGDCRPHAAVLCLTVLVAAGAVALLTAAAGRRATPRTERRRTARPPAAGRPPHAAPDPVEDLCISRT